MHAPAPATVFRGVRPGWCNGMKLLGCRANSPSGQAGDTALLTVIDQHLKARMTQFLAVLLQAGQNRKIALINHLAAEANRITRTSLFVLLAATVLRHH
jgi:hypothetical protein